MNPAANLELAVQNIDSAIAALNAAALDAPSPDVTDECKQIAVYLRHQAASVHHLRAYLTPSLSALLEESLGGGVGEVCS